MKKINYIIICLILSFYSCKTITIQGKKIKSADICDNCNPGNYGPIMLMKKKTYDPQLEDNTSPKKIAFQILGHVFSEGYKGGDLKIPCSNTSAKSPFLVSDVRNLGSTGSSGQSLFYNEKETLNLDVTATVNSDLESIKAANPSVSVANLDSFKAKLTAAYSKFANKELNVEGKYYQYSLNDQIIVELAKNLNYEDCRAYIYSTTNPKRMITALGLVYFEIKYSSNSVDDISSELVADAAAYGITFNIGVKFKRNISKKLNKVTEGYYQIVTWRTVGISHLNRIAN
ncbi:hypothetical protein [Aureibaculum luteum]|uniref:hypothetical protein n=1 Tax=Aureibaculum luteum TaxID=1548456 RepID=UPI001300B58B|nr:hypothetical protein [Aureibaculum luteum]